MNTGKVIEIVKVTHTTKIVTCTHPESRLKMFYNKLGRVSKIICKCGKIYRY